MHIRGRLGLFEGDDRLERGSAVSVQHTVISEIPLSFGLGEDENGRGVMEIPIGLWG
jgi:hypothetical protein